MNGKLNTSNIESPEDEDLEDLLPSESKPEIAVFATLSHADEYFRIKYCSRN